LPVYDELHLRWCIGLKTTFMEKQDLPRPAWIPGNYPVFTLTFYPVQIKLLADLFKVYHSAQNAAAQARNGSLGFAVKNPRFWGMWAATLPTYPKIWTITTAIPNEPARNRLVFNCAAKNLCGGVYHRACGARSALPFFSANPALTVIKGCAGVGSCPFGRW
jgi:hypothetical protein